MSGNNYTAFNAMADIITSPGKAMENVKNHTAWLWWPLGISIVMACLLFVYYYSWVDFEFLVNETIRMQPPERRAEVAEVFRNYMTPNRMLLSAVLTTTLFTLVIFLVQSTYLHLANKLTTGAEIKWKQWFSFSAWTAFVGIFATMAAFVSIFMAGSNNQLGQDGIQPLSMNSLFIKAKPGDPWFIWGSWLQLTNLWMLVLMSIGYQKWTGASMVKSTIIATLPWVLIFGIWAIMI